MVSGGRGHLDAVAAAFQFLSRLPVKKEVDFTPTVLRQSTIYYPLVGLAIAAVVWISAIVFSLVLPAFPAAVLTLIVWVWLTGGLHLDGWMDAADALLSYRTRERMLEIMKDSRVGAMGVLACVLLLLLKLSLIYTVLTEGPVIALVLLPMVWSRWFMVRAIHYWPTARGDEGLAVLFKDLGTSELIRCTLWAGGITLLLVAGELSLYNSNYYLAAFEPIGYPHTGYYVLCAVLLPLVAWGIGHGVAAHIHRRLGGLTGDIYGALNELLETALLLYLITLYGIY